MTPADPGIVAEADNWDIELEATTDPLNPATTKFIVLRSAATLNSGNTKLELPINLPLANCRDTGTAAERQCGRGKYLVKSVTAHPWSGSGTSAVGAMSSFFFVGEWGPPGLCASSIANVRAVRDLHGMRWERSGPSSMPAGWICRAQPRQLAHGRAACACAAAIGCLKAPLHPCHAPPAGDPEQPTNVEGVSSSADTDTAVKIRFDRPEFDNAAVRGRLRTGAGVGCINSALLVVIAASFKAAGAAACYVEFGMQLPNAARMVRSLV